MLWMARHRAVLLVHPSAHGARLVRREAAVLHETLRGKGPVAALFPRRVRLAQTKAVTTSGKEVEGGGCRASRAPLQVVVEHQRVLNMRGRVVLFERRKETGRIEARRIEATRCKYAHAGSRSLCLPLPRALSLPLSLSLSASLLNSISSPPPQRAWK